MSTRRTLRITGFVVKALFSLFIFCICSLLIWRIFYSTKEPDSVKTLVVNEALADAYEEHGDDLILKYQNQLSLTYSEENAGYFGISQYVIIPEANQVQIVLRYNNATLTHLKNDFALEALPKKGEEHLDVTLRKITDLTPNNNDDDNDPAALDIQRIAPSQILTDTTALYTYHRYVFDGVVIDETAVCSIYMDIYYEGAVDYEQKAYGAMLIYDNLGDWFEYNLTAADKKALKGAQS